VGASSSLLQAAAGGISPLAAARAYQSVAGGDFGAMLGQALQGALQTGQAAEQQAARAVAGQADLTQVVQAVSRAELTLQTATAIRDRVVQAYQDIMKMPI